MKFSIKQIAAQAGVSTATVDRVLNQRPGVRYHTEQRVLAAQQELEEQSGLAGFRGRRFYFDVIVQAPERFTAAVRQAMLDVIPTMQPFRIQPRFHLMETIELPSLQKLIQNCSATGSQGVILKAPDNPVINDAVAGLAAVEVPVVTLVTDLPYSKRIAYVGIDNRAAGATAAYLLAQWLGQQPVTVAVVLSSDRFRGEEEREIGFRQLLRQRYPHISLVEVSGGQGIYRDTFKLMVEALKADYSICAVYSVGGGNQSILDAFDAEKRPLRAFIGHDLDEENRALLLSHKIDALIDHNLQEDVRRCFLHILGYQRAITFDSGASSKINVLTPYSVAGA